MQRNQPIKQFIQTYIQLREKEHWMTLKGLKKKEKVQNSKHPAEDAQKAEGWTRES